MNKVVKKTWCVLLVSTAILALIPSCATTSESAEGPKFYEADAANLVVRYSSDNTIYRIKPDGREGNFYHIYSRQEICEADATRNGRRDLAVVLIGNQFTPALDRQVKQGWVDALSKLNYRRVVVLRSCDGGDRVNGLRVVEDRLNAQVISAPAEGRFASISPAQQTLP